jgi:hypothetical protein
MCYAIICYLHHHTSTDRTGLINRVQKDPGAKHRPIVALSGLDMTTWGSGSATAIVSVNHDDRSPSNKFYLNLYCN